MPAAVGFGWRRSSSGARATAVWRVTGDSGVTFFPGVFARMFFDFFPLVSSFVGFYRALRHLELAGGNGPPMKTSISMLTAPTFSMREVTVFKPMQL